MQRDEKRLSILFVCLGNICRSPLAEGAMRAAADKAKLDIVIDSAGTGGWHVGNPPDPRSIKVAAENGVDISGLRARQVSPADFDTFTHIIALDNQNLADLKAMRPARPNADLSLLFDHVPGYEGMDVADPYYDDESGFARTWHEVTMAADAICRKSRP